MNYKIFYHLIILVLLVSCTEKELPDNAIIGSNGIYILNEGNFSWTNASLSFLDTDSDKIHNHIFENTNNSPLGDVGQSMTIIDSLAYIVLNNSGKIYVMNINTNQFSGKITGLTSPRNIQVINSNKAYVSDLYNNSISIINPSTFEITGYIELGHTSEQMISINNYIYVLSWSFDNKLFIIDPISDLVIDSLAVGLQPNSMVIDNNNKLWILCDGGYPGIQGGQDFPSIYCIDPISLNIEKTFYFDNISSSPIELCINDEGNILSFINGGIYSMDISAERIPDQPIILPEDHNFYGLALFENVIYAADTRNYIQSGFLFRYFDNGTMIDSFQVGVVPGFICNRN